LPSGTKKVEPVDPDECNENTQTAGLSGITGINGKINKEDYGYATGYHAMCLMLVFRSRSYEHYCTQQRIQNLESRKFMFVEHADGSCGVIDFRGMDLKFYDPKARNGKN
jgi:hypothetical protein